MTDEPFTGQRLISLLNEMGWSQTEMGRCLGVSKRLISRSVSGRWRAPPEVEAFWRQLERVVTDKATLAKGMAATRDAIEAIADNPPERGGRWVRQDEGAQEALEPQAAAE